MCFNKCSGVFYDSHVLNMLTVLTLHINLVEMKFAKKCYRIGMLSSILLQ